MDLPRFHGVEFNDHPSVPRVVRETIVESLSRTLDWGKMLDELADIMLEFWAQAGVSEVLDLGAGAGGPARVLARAMQRSGAAGEGALTFMLCDLFPLEDSWRALKQEYPGRIDYITHPVDATQVPEGLAASGRMMVNVLHHFKPQLAQRVFEDAVRAGSPIFVAECFERNPLQFLNFAPAGLASLFLNPLLTPRRALAKALLTYGAPGVMLGLSIWDGLTSSLRVYTRSELFAMVEPFGQSYHWEYGNFTYAPMGKGYYFCGRPRV